MSFFKVCTIQGQALVKSKLREVTGEEGEEKCPQLISDLWTEPGHAEEALPAHGPGSGISLDTDEAGLKVMCWRGQRGEERDKV